MPRIGLELQLPLHDNQTSVSWFGLGPFENYPDRLAAARAGVYTQPLAAMHTPYIFPTDSGLRCNTQKLQVNQLEISGQFHFAVSRYAQTHLAAAKHTHELREEDKIYVRIDHQHMGVGGDDSWSPSVHQAFQLTDKTYQYRVSMKPRTHH